MTTEETKTEETRQEQRTWTEELEVAAEELIQTVRRLFKEGNVRRIVIRQADGEVLLNIPFTVGAFIGGVIVLSAPVLSVLILLAGSLAKFKLQVIRVNDENQA